MTFQTLGLCAPILTALEEHGYERPSPIQEKAIPPALAGRDVLGCAQTGTGKTCAFAAPILQRLSASRVQGHPLRALILTPTRELAIQIEESFLAYGKHLSLRCAVIFGGVGQNPQVEALGRGVDILVATPGRLMDLYQQGFVKLDQLEIFVLDEADRMLDMGFIHDVKKILKWLPKQKQTMLFSATMPPEITELVNSLLHDPVRVAVDPVSSPVEAIEQSVYFVDKNNKTKLLAHLIRELDVKNALVFTRTKHGANKVARELSKYGITAAAILCALANSLMPEGAVRRVGKLACGLLMLSAVLRPLVEVEALSPGDLLKDYQARAAVQAQTLEEERNAALKSVIEQEFAAYIVDKAAQMGAACTAQVTCQLGEDGVFLPRSAALQGSFTPRQKEDMACILEEELAIPRARQSFPTKEEGFQ